MFVDGPCKFIVQLPRNDKHQQRPHGHDAGNDDKEWLRLRPYFGANGVVDDQNAGDSLLDLLNLDRTVDQKPDISNA